VPLADIEALYRWAESHDPPYSLFRAVEAWVHDLGADPFQPPSWTWSLNEGEPYEVRMAEPDGMGVVITYTVVHDSLQTDLVGIVPL
jgi:hypothetical protein